MTARNLQDKVKKAGLPWSAAKGFDTFNPVSQFIEKKQIPDPHNVRLWLKVNDQVRQDGNSKDMIFNIPRLIEHVSSIMRLEVGDLLLTGESPSPSAREMQRNFSEALPLIRDDDRNTTRSGTSEPGRYDHGGSGATRGAGQGARRAQARCCAAKSRICIQRVNQ